MERTAHYNDTGTITTVRGVRTQLLTIVGIATFILAAYAVRTHHYGTTLNAGLCIVLTTIGTLRNLREFEALDLDPHVPVARFAFRLLTSMSTWTLVPMILLLLSTT